MSSLVVMSILVLPFCHKDRVLRLGVLINLSGPGGRAGRYIRDGVLFAAGKMMCSIKYLVFIGDYDESDSELKKKIDELYAKGVRIFIGPVTSHAALVALNHSESSNKKILFIVPYAATTKLSKRKDFFVRTCIDNRAFVKAFLNWIKRRNINRVFVFWDTVNPEFTLDILDNLKQKGIALGSFAFSSKGNFAERLPDAIKAVFHYKPQVVLFLARTRETAILCQKLRDEGFQGKFVATIWAQTPDLIKWGGRAVEGLTIISFVRASYSNPEYQRFSREFESKAGYRLNARAVRAVEAVEILCDAIHSLNSIDFKNIYKKLINHHFRTLMDEIYIDEYGDAKRPVYEITVKRGKFITEGILLDEH